MGRLTNKTWSHYENILCLCVCEWHSLCIGVHSVKGVCSEERLQVCVLCPWSICLSLPLPAILWLLSDLSITLYSSCKLPRFKVMKLWYPLITHLNIFGKQSQNLGTVRGYFHRTVHLSENSITRYWVAHLVEGKCDLT